MAIWGRLNASFKKGLHTDLLTACNISTFLVGSLLFQGEPCCLWRCVQVRNFKPLYRGRRDKTQLVYSWNSPGNESRWVSEEKVLVLSCFVWKLHHDSSSPRLCSFHLGEWSCRPLTMFLFRVQISKKKHSFCVLGLKLIIHNLMRSWSKVCHSCQNQGLITERAAVVFPLDEVQVSMLFSGLLYLDDVLNLFF